MGLNRLELLTSRLSGVRSNQLSYKPLYNDITFSSSRLLFYILPIAKYLHSERNNEIKVILLDWLLSMGLNRLELSTSRLSGVRSNQLSYKPLYNDITFSSSRLLFYILPIAKYLHSERNNEIKVILLDWLLSIDLNRLELLTSRLSGVRSNQPDYKPMKKMLSLYILVVN